MRPGSVLRLWGKADLEEINQPLIFLNYYPRLRGWVGLPGIFARPLL